VVKHVKDFAGKVDIEEFAGEEKIGVAGVVGTILVDSGKRERLGPVSENADGLAQKIVRIASMVPDVFLDGDLLGDGEITFLHQLVDIELDGDGGGNAAGGGVRLS